MVSYITNLANIIDSENIRRFLIGFVGGTIVRSTTNADWFITGNNPQKAPGNSGTNRSFTFFVNAPKTGDYYLKGEYYIASTRILSFPIVGKTGTNNQVNVNNLLSSKKWDGILR
ncbi:variably expressed lipoprotein and hemagglutinin (VlhA) family domain protein [Mycoplasmoides gallisepticum]